MVLIGGHWLSTTTVDLLIWAVLCWLVIRAVRTGGGPRWLWAGLVAGIGLQNKTLVLFLLAALVVGLLLAGPRRVFRDRLALGRRGTRSVDLGAEPDLAVHAWLAPAGAVGGDRRGELGQQPTLVAVSAVPAGAGQSGAACRSGSRVWWCSSDSGDLRPYRFLAVAYLVLVVVFLLTGGKPYYIAGLYPALLAAGALPTLRWVRAGRGRRRPVLLGLAFVVVAAQPRADAARCYLSGLLGLRWWR